MALPNNRDDREFNKFVEDGSGNVAIRTTAVIEAGDIEIGAVELKSAAADTRASVIAPNSAAVAYYLGVMPARYMATPPTLTDTYTSPLLLDVNGRLQVSTEESEANAPQAYGIDAAGADTYTTVVTATANRHHITISLQGSNDAIVSVDSGTTAHFYIPANSAHTFDGVLIASGATVQGKNANAGNNYTNLAITIW